MKTLKIFSTILLVISIIFSCKKASVAPAGLSSVNVINASADVPSIAVNFINRPIPFYLQKAVLSYGSSAEYGNPGGILPIVLVSSADTLHSIFQGTFNLPTGNIYSLYVCGNLPKIDTLLLQDHIPVHPDSTAGARFINLSPDSGPVTIMLQGSSAAEFSGLAYKRITAFKGYSAVSAVTNNGGYTYQVNDASGNLLATFSWTPSVFKNNTLVISGLKSNSSIQVFAVNNY